MIVRVVLLFSVILAVIGVATSFSMTRALRRARDSSVALRTRLFFPRLHQPGCSCSCCTGACSCVRCARPTGISTRLAMVDSDGTMAAAIKSKDETENLATVTVTLSPDQTQKAFDQACEMFNEEVKTRGYKVS